MSRSSSRIAGASMKNRITGCGPPRSGWTMKVVVAPSFVGMSSWRSIMESPWLSALPHIKDRKSCPSASIGAGEGDWASCPSGLHALSPLAPAEPRPDVGQGGGGEEPGLDQIAVGQAFGLGQQAVEPLHPQPPGPARGGGLFAGLIVEGRPHGEEHAPADQ